MRPLLVGLGRGGARILDWFLEQTWDKVAPETLAVDVDPNTLDDVHTKETVLIGEEYSLDQDERLTTSLVGTLVQDQFDQLESYLDDHSPRWIVTGLGGVFGGTAAPIVAREANKRDGQTFGVVSQPFEFESAERLDRATHARRRLGLYADDVFSLRLELILKYLSRDKVRPSELFGLANQVMSNLLYFLMTASLNGSKVDEEAVDRLRNLSRQQKQSVVLNSLAPGWRSSTGETTQEDSEAVDSTPFFKRLKKTFSQKE